jgi:hypothetical protein
MSTADAVEITSTPASVDVRKMILSTAAGAAIRY